MSKRKSIVTITVNYSCGCCSEELDYDDLKEAKRAMKQAGIGQCRVVKDGYGHAYFDVDTRMFFIRNGRKWDTFDMEK